MSIRDNPGITTMPVTTRDWTKFINELSVTIDSLTGGGPPVPDPGDPDWPDYGDTSGFVTLTTNQTITGLKTFSGNNPRFNTFPLWNNNNVGAQIALLDEDTSPQPTDFVPSTQNKKVPISRLNDEAYAFFMAD